MPEATRLLACFAVAGLLAGCGGSDEEDQASLGQAEASNVQLTPTSDAFGQEELGFESPHRVFVLSVNAGVFSPRIAVSGDFSQTNDCPDSIVGGPGVRCLISISFLPSALGSRTGTLSTGGPTASLTGEGIEPEEEEGDDASPKAKCKKKGKGKKARKKLKRCKKKAAKEKAAPAEGEEEFEEDFEEPE